MPTLESEYKAPNQYNEYDAVEEKRKEDRRKAQRRAAPMPNREHPAIRKPKRKSSASNQGGASIGGGT